MITETFMLSIRKSRSFWVAPLLLGAVSAGCADPCGDYLDACVACGNTEEACQASIDAAKGDEDACQAALDDIEAVGGCP